MPRAPESTTHAERLRDLARRFRGQERWMTSALHDLQARLDHWSREASFHQLRADACDPLLQRCEDLQNDYDELATELVHVRMAIAGADEELAEQHLTHSEPRRLRA